MNRDSQEQRFSCPLEAARQEAAADGSAGDRAEGLLALCRGMDRMFWQRLLRGAMKKEEEA